MTKEYVIKVFFNPSNCQCQCDKSCNISQYLDYSDCMLKKKKLIDPLIEKCTENDDQTKIVNITVESTENDNKTKIVNITVENENCSCSLYCTYDSSFYIFCWSYYFFCFTIVLQDQLQLVFD